MAICKVDARKWMDSLESAHITVTSPTGKSISLYKGAFGNREHFKSICKFDEEIKNILLQGIGASKKYPVILTNQQMEILLKIASGDYV